MHAAACSSMQQHAAACSSMRQHAAACGSMRQHAAAYCLRWPRRLGQPRQYAAACIGETRSRGTSRVKISESLRICRNFCSAKVAPCCHKTRMLESRTSYFLGRIVSTSILHIILQITHIVHNYKGFRVFVLLLFLPVRN
jgi:hypothetical protein